MAKRWLNHAEGVGFNYAGALFLFTPEALANVSPGLERSDNPGFTKQTIS